MQAQYEFVNKFLFLLPSVYHKTKFAEVLFCGALKSEHATATLFSLGKRIYPSLS